jgi:hypothetical protein
VVLLALIVGVVVSINVPVAAADLFVPGGFRLAASNGYSMHAIIFDGDPRGEQDGLILFVSRKGDGATYVVRKGVEVTETTVSADLGKLGSVDLHWVPSNKPAVERSACSKEPIEFESGFYEGQFDFEGEEGYTEAHRTRARGEIRLAASLICGSGLDEGVGGHAPGAQLKLRRRWDGGHLESEVTKNSPTRPARFSAAIEEASGGLLIEREVRTAASPKAFEFDVPSQSAILRPPSPFSGTAHFERQRGPKGHLKGSLIVNFPGRSHVSLSGTEGTLQRWVENPRHPFRVNEIALQRRQLVTLLTSNNLLQ